MNKIFIEVDRELFQWEKNRYVTVGPQELLDEVYCLQFYNKKSTVAQESFLSNNNKVKIPDKLLTQNIPITVIACSKEGDGTQVLAYKTFKVLPRVKPESYRENDETIVYYGGSASGIA